MKPSTLLAAGLSLALLPAANALSLNLDLDGLAVVVTPPDSYAGVGVPGVWNAIPSPPVAIGPWISLQDVADNSVDADLMLSGLPFGSACVPLGVGPNIDLLNDGHRVLPGSTLDVRIRDLCVGDYEVIVYGWNACSPLLPIDIAVSFEGNPAGALATITTIGPVFPRLLPGTTFATSAVGVDATGNDVVISVSGGPGLVALEFMTSGIQLSHTPESIGNSVCAAGVNSTGDVALITAVGCPEISSNTLTLVIED